MVIAKLALPNNTTEIKKIKRWNYNMKMETKINLYSTLFYSLFFGVIFTIVGGLITSGAVDWPNFPATVLVGAAVGLVIGLIIPLGKWSMTLASKTAEPGTFLYSLVMNTVVLVIMLIFMCPVLTIFIGSVLHGAPVVAVLPGSYSLFIPFFLIGIVLLMIFSGFIMKLAMKCAGVPNAAIDSASDKESQGNN